MSTVNFNIAIVELYRQIFATSAHTARAREAMGIPHGIIERMLLTPDDEKKITPLIDESINEVFSDIARYHPGSSSTFIQEEENGYYHFTIDAPENYPPGNEEKLRQSALNYIVNRTLQNWYANIKPDEAGIPAAKAQNNATTMRELLTQRIKPSKQQAGN